MRRWIAQKGLSYVTLVAGIEVGGSFDEAPDRAFRALAGSSTAPAARAARSR
jgi:hypothetical protein